MLIVGQRGLFRTPQQIPDGHETGQVSTRQQDVKHETLQILRIVQTQPSLHHEKAIEFG